jgi:hypothetical protein
MIKKLLAVATMAACLTTCAYAQETSTKPRFYKANKADATFTMFDEWINHRHTAQLGG